MSWRTALLLFAVTLATRLPFATTHLWAHDSVLYERAMTLFDPAAQSPQPPGYLWYVLLARAVGMLTGDANAALVLIAAVASAAAVALLYVLGARLGGEAVGRAAALLLLTSVTFWGEGAVAYPYTLLAALTTGCALLFWHARERRTAASLAAASLAWGLAVGFRTDLALFLAPLWLLVAWRATWPARVGGAVAVAVPVLAWLAASALASPSPASFVGALAAQGRSVDEASSVLSNGAGAVARNAYELARYLGRGLFAMTPLLLLGLLPSVRGVLGGDRGRVAFVAVWSAAPLAIYLPIHIGEYGYVFSMLPGLALAAAALAAAAARASARPAVLVALVGGAVLVNAGVFLFSSAPLGAADLARRDRGVAERLAALSELEPTCTVVATGYDALVVARYVKDRPIASWGPAESRTFSRPLPLVAPRCRAAELVVVLWDDLLRTGEGDWATATMPHGALLRSTIVPRTSTLRVRDALTVDVIP